MKTRILRIIAASISVIIASMILAVLCTACNPVNRLTRKAEGNQQVFENVGRQWVLTHGCIVDTPPPQIFEHDSLIKIPIHDTVNQKLPCDNFSAKTKDGTKVEYNKKSGDLSIDNDSLRILHHMIDSIKTTLIDRTQIGICMDSFQAYKAAFHEQQNKNENISLQLKASQAEYKKEKMEVVMDWIIFAVVLGALIFLRVRGIL